jgi:hypothetical protein
VRTLGGLNPVGAPAVDDITYSAAEGPPVFTHPVCPTTWRYGVFIGNEWVATGYEHWWRAAASRLIAARPYAERSGTSASVRRVTALSRRQCEFTSGSAAGAVSAH